MAIAAVARGAQRSFVVAITVSPGAQGGGANHAPGNKIMVDAAGAKPDA
jgi:hypothetical protein